MRKHPALAAIVVAALLAGGGTLFAQSAPASAAPGVLVAGVSAGGPADKAGIARGDIILAVDSKDVNTIRDVTQVLAGHAAGDNVAVKLSHGDSTKTVSVTLQARDGRVYLGVMLVPSLAYEGRPGEPGELPGRFSGALVIAVTPDSPAAQAGLKARELIMSVDGTKIDESHSLGDLIAQHKAGDTVTLAIASWGEPPHDVQATLAQNADKTGAYLGVEYRQFPGRFGWGPRREREEREGGPQQRTAPEGS